MAECKRSHIAIKERRRHIAIKERRRTHIHLGNASLLKTAPQPPQNLSVTNVTATTVELDWDDLATPFDDYTVYAQNSESGVVEQEVEGIQLSETEIMGLTTGDQYEFWVVSVRDDIESADSNHVTATPEDLIAPDPPTNISVLEEGDGFVRVGADPSPSGDVAGYNAYQDEGSGGEKDNSSLLSEAEIADYQFDDLTNGTTYGFWFTAVDDAGNESAESNHVSATPSGASNDFSLSYPQQPNVNDGGNAVIASKEPQIDISGDATFEFWMKPMASNRSYGVCMNGPNSNPRQYTVFVASNDDFLRVHTDNGNAGDWDISGTVGVWTHVAVVVLGNAFTLYLNAIDQGTMTNSGGITSISEGTLNIGRRESDDFSWQGGLDEVRIWDVARTQQQIQDNMDTILEGNESGLVAYYRFEDDSDPSVAIDYSSFGNHGDIIGDISYSTDVPF